jgi:dolichol-phosphate mannosyltransferase
VITALDHEPRRISESTVSVVLPVYNEQEILETLAGRVEEVLARCGCRYELIFVNDGSTDNSGQILDALAARPCVRVLHLSRNFGQQAAVHAGLLHAVGDAIVVMDSDLQDEPESISAFLEQWEAGYDVVYAVRVDRKESVLKRSLYFAFYRVLHLVSETPIPKDAGNFGLIDRSAARQIAHLVDRDRYYPGLRRWVGFRQTGIPVERKARHDNVPRLSFVQLFRLAKTAIFSFSKFPLTMFYGIALVSILVCAGLCSFTLYHKLITGLAVPGWTSITITASFFGALNALGIGILGEYVARIYDQVRARPLFIVDRAAGFAGTPTAAEVDRTADYLSAGSYAVSRTE